MWSLQVQVRKHIVEMKSPWKICLLIAYCSCKIKGAKYFIISVLHLIKDDGSTGHFHLKIKKSSPVVIHQPSFKVHEGLPRRILRQLLRPQQRLLQLRVSL